MHDLLMEPLIGVRLTNAEDSLSLPALLAALSAGEVEAYTGLRPHQADPWHVFLVQLAASIQARRPTEELPSDPSYWRDGLLDLSDGMHTAWHLVVEDVTKPAFLQHPWISWEAEAVDFGVKQTRRGVMYTPKASAPDELDVLVTAKNHDVKMARFQADVVDAWLYALLVLQTTSGVLGAGNYGIIRMNAGVASRPVIAWARSLNPSVRFVDEVRMLHGLRRQTCRDFHYASRGLVLTWLTRWDRANHYCLCSDLEPWFIESCRPVRLLRACDGSLYALGATTKARQIGPKTIENGDVGDPWIPINVEDKKKGRSALTLSADGLSPQRLSDLLFEQGFELTAMQRPRPGEGAGWFVASCLVRGQGTTEGFHRIELPVPAKARLALLNKQHKDTLAMLAQQLLSDTKEVQRALSAAFTVLIEGGPAKTDFDRGAVKRWVDSHRAHFVTRWGHIFFPTLWRGADEAHDVLRKEWRQRLVNEAQSLFDEAVMRLPTPSNRGWRAVVRAQSALRGMLDKLGLPTPAITSAEPTDSTDKEMV
ncbi:type I-E CRISPR-associated protein Cse1/CasA [Castellaniella sp. S9]|uniref:type I-E CRISPR-associated protein Cse1/CasA n=1 Tax=Castellaniella sp. S9 TaxID=2993652 RepID=UPI0022B3688E|nr:type I-E CRISPR-associated protein Cse1/CasA [Castellaniella sp. S9]